MNKIKAVLIDDEQSARNVLTNLLERSSIDISIIATCNNLEEGVKKIKELQPNVVFLDVQMPNYAGYEIVNFFETINFEIIFVTAYDQYAIRAFELNAIDYLVKPISRQKLASPLLRLQESLQKKTDLIDYQVLLKSINDKNFQKIVIPETGNRRIVNLDDIIAIEADGAYSSIHLNDNSVITISKNLKYFETILPKDTSFFRSHRTWIVNLKYLEFLNKKELVISIKGTVKAKISRNRLDDFERIIQF